MRLSVVIPVYNEPEQLAATIRSVSTEIESSAFGNAEIVVADDGSNEEIDPSALSASSAVPVRVERLPENAGRFEARRTGLAASNGELVLFVDAGVTLVPGSLAFLDLRIGPGREIWNADTVIATDGSPLTLFWRAVNAIAFSAYLSDPRETTFGLAEFDHFPKGTTCFLAPAPLLREAFGSFASRYLDTRNANDDGPIIRHLAARQRINIAPGFACVYTPRNSVRGFVRHAMHRGVVFVDGHGRGESRFFPLVVAFFPLSAGLVVLTTRRPVAAPLAGLGIAALAGGLAGFRRRPVREIASFAALAPLYALAHGLGMWRGAGLAVVAWRRR